MVETIEELKKAVEKAGLSYPTSMTFSVPISKINVESFIGQLKRFKEEEQEVEHEWLAEEGGER